MYKRILEFFSGRRHQQRMLDVRRRFLLGRSDLANSEFVGAVGIEDRNTAILATVLRHSLSSICSIPTETLLPTDSPRQLVTIMDWGQALHEYSLTSVEFGEWNAYEFCGIVLRQLIFLGVDTTHLEQLGSLPRFCNGEDAKGNCSREDLTVGEWIVEAAQSINRFLPLNWGDDIMADLDELRLGD